MNPTKIKIGDIVNLKDRQTIIQIMKEKVGDYGAGANLAVKEVHNFSLNDAKANWILVETDTSLVVLFKVVGEVYETRVIFKPEGFPEGDREDFKENGCGWLFENAHGDDYADIITNGDLEYKEKHPALHPTLDSNFATVKEWKCPKPGAENPEIIIFEVGGVDDPRGGFIKFFMGTTISNGDVELYQV